MSENEKKDAWTKAYESSRMTQSLSEDRDNDTK